MKQYIWAMGFRVLAFPLGVWALVSGWTVVGWTLALAAVVLPSFAVMLANAVDRRADPGVPRSPTRQLPPGPS